MGKQIKILMLINFISIVLLVSTLSAAKAVPPGWSAGDIILWGQRNTTRTGTYNDERTLGAITETIVLDETEFNITAINTLLKEYDAFETDSTTRVFHNDWDYAANLFVNDELDLEDFLDINYVWDYEHNVTSLTTFNLDIDPWYLYEPDFIAYNKGFRDMLNGTVIVDTVNDPYQSLIHNFTLSNVLASFPVSIMGKSTLETGFAQFKNNTRSWKFEFDLGGHMKQTQWNGTMNIHYPYEVYKKSIEFAITEAGVLEKFIYTVETKITIDEFTTEYFNELKTVLGGLKSASASFSTFTIIGGLVLIAAVFTSLKYRKR
ncbi:MAG: hypothetical protein JXA54_10990 [Candidatus Heimdallarchaeota archaeon]|nr:hypothetical protein [Candidatus Heimdallarchaeota archaeon]